MSQYIIRPLNINDYTTYISHIHSRVEKKAYNNFINNILNENHQIVVVEYQGKLIGSGTLLIEHKLTYGGCKMGHIENILVDETMRGKKIGSMIVNYLNNIAIHNKCYRIDLTCSNELKPFYISNGYTIKNVSMTRLIPENYNV
jgi:glucosamine-phosphate N-acetyltransferase